MTKFALLAAATALALPAVAHADGRTTPVAYALTGTSYSQNFDTLSSAHNTLSNVLPDGWQIIEKGGAAADGQYLVHNGGSNSGNIFSFGAQGSTDRALGAIGSGQVAESFFGGIFTNATGSTIESLAFSYAGEQWRGANSTNDGLFFSYSLNATELDNGTWFDVAALDFAPLAFTGGPALNGNAYTVDLSALVSGLSIADGESFAFRWRDYNSSGNDYGLAVDDFTITATLAASGPAVPEPATWAMMLGGFGLLGGAMRRRTSVVRFA